MSPFPLAIVLALGIHPALAADTAILQNEQLRLGVSTAGGARVTELFAKAQGRNLIHAEAKAPLYQLEFADRGAPAAVDALQADNTSLAAPDARTLVITSRHARLGLEVICTIALTPGATTLSFNLEVRRTEARPTIGIIRYPGLAVPLQAASGTARILLPVADGEVIVDPMSALRDGETRGYDYPGIASAQLMAIYDGRGGAAAFAADGAGNYKRLCVRRAGPDAQLYFENVVYHLRTPTLALPYSLRLGTFQGGWEHAADLYKDWATTQPWCARRISGRALPPQATEPSFFLGVNVREARGSAESVDRSAEIPRFVQSWKEGLGLPITGILLGWEKHGPWVAPDYFPPYGGESSFARLLQGLHDGGSRAMLYLSGLNVTVEKTARNGAPAYRIGAAEMERARGSAVVAPGGGPRLDGSPSAEGIGTHLVLCPTTSLARQILDDALDRCLGMGADVVQVDQIVGGGTPPCFAENHGHPPGGGTTTFAALARILDGLGEKARARSPRAAVSLEEPGELFIPHVDLFHCREYMQGMWPRDQPGALGVPLFAYLYHEYAPGYGGDSAPLAVGNSDPGLALYAQAMNLVTGRLPGAAVWMKMIPFADTHPLLRAFMKDTAGLLRSAAAPYILRGRILDLGTTSASRRLAFTVAGRKVGFESADLLARGFQIEDGSMGVLYVNASDAPRRTRLDFGPGREGAAGVSVWPISGRRLRSGEEYTMKPWEIVFIRVDSSVKAGTG